MRIPSPRIGILPFKSETAEEESKKATNGASELLRKSDSPNAHTEC